MESQSAAINDLPYDIFRQIIIYAYTHTPRSYQRCQGFSHIQILAPPFSASRVCRAWRCALLSDQTMWTNLSIPEIKPSGVKELILRSESAPLNIILFMKEDQMRYYNMSNALSHIFRYIDRFKSLSVYIQVTYPFFWSSARMAPIRRLLLFLQRPAPSLQVFSFRYIGADPSHQQMFLNKLFSGSAPNLKRMDYQVSGTAFRDLISPLFYRLSELHLSCCDNANLDIVLALLKLSPSLEVLGISVDWHLVDWHRVPSERSGSANLPHLQRLVLKAFNSTELITFVNEYLTLPPNVRWDITVSVDHLFADSPSLLEIIPQVRFTGLNVLFKGSPYITPDDETVPTDFDEIDGNKLTYNFHDTAFLAGIWCDLLMNSADFSSITHFNLEFMWWERLRVKTLFMTIYSIFFAMQNLKYLVIKQNLIYRSNPRDQACLHCLSALMSPGRDGAKPLCPLLRQITLKLEEPFNRTYASMLYACSKARRERGCPVEILVYYPEVWQSGVKSELEGNIRVSVLPFDAD